MGGEGQERGFRVYYWQEEGSRFGVQSSSAKRRTDWVVVSGNSMSNLYLRRLSPPLTNIVQFS